MIHSEGRVHEENVNGTSGENNNGVHLLKWKSERERKKLSEEITVKP